MTIEYFKIPYQDMSEIVCVTQDNYKDSIVFMAWINRENGEISRFTSTETVGVWILKHKK